MEAYKFTDAVVESKALVTELDANTIRVGDIEVQPGEILFGKNEDNSYYAYKIEELLSDSTAAVSVPALDEIYAELDVYGEYQFDVNDLAVNPDLEDEIRQNVRNSGFFSALVVTAYANEDEKDATVDVTIIKDHKAKTVKCVVTITLEPGENGLFGFKELKNHSVSLTLTSTLGLTARCNFQGFRNWDVSASVASDFEWKIEISYLKKIIDKDPALDKLLLPRDEDAEINDFQKYVKEITEALDKAAADATAGELKLFDWDVPIIHVPGLYFSAEIKLDLSVKAMASVTIGQDSTVVYTVGICLIDSEFEPYSSCYHSENDVSFSLRGRLEAKAGPKLEITAFFVSERIANVKLSPSIGLYVKVFAAVPVSSGDADLDSFWYGYLEPGIYVGCSFDASINLLGKKLGFSYQLIDEEIEFEFLTIGEDEIVTGFSPSITSVRAVNSRVNVPEFILEYYDVKSGIFSSKKLKSKDYKDITFTNEDGTSLALEDMKLTIPDTDSGSCAVTAAYLHSDGNTYTTTFHALFSAGVIEGKVSAYAEDLSSSALEGATVTLYSSPDCTNPISTQTTDSDGKFVFYAEEGTYWMVITAEGYHAITTCQQVNERETTYTEHILLLDEYDAAGDGLAGGTVRNALDGRPVSGVTIKLRQDWNNQTGPYVENFETSTDSRGQYIISQLPGGHYTVVASIDGFVTGYCNVTLANANYTLDYDLAISPELNDDEMRIVLTWGSAPKDLDAHLMGYNQYEDFVDVYHAWPLLFTDDKGGMVCLDVDDATGYGPETITISGERRGPYTYVVHDYTNRDLSESSELGFSNAVVQVFSRNALVAQYHVPTGQAGTYWTVFQIGEDGSILPVNSVSNTNPGYDNSSPAEDGGYAEKTHNVVYSNEALAVVDDSAYVLDGTEMDAVFDAAIAVTETTGYSIVIVLTDDLHGMSTSKFCRIYYDDALYQDGRTNGAGYMLLVDVASSDYYLGACHSAPTETINNMILSSSETIGAYIEKGDYETAALNFLMFIYTLNNAQ